MAASPPTSPAAGRGRRIPRVSGDERERAILETAERLLGERTLQQISVDDLARGAGISRPTFYFYFASKEAVLLTLLDRLVEEARGGIQLAMLGEDPRRVLRDGLVAIHRMFTEHRAVILAGSSMRADSAATRELWTSVLERFVQETAEAIESERARGAAPLGPDARDLAVALNLMNESVLRAALEEDGPSIGDDALLDTLTELWLRAIYAGAEPPGG
jgi:AcrR family transcriptional regulator